jgi:magnesium chelatase family protein
MNPCPCGYLGDPDAACRCTAEQVQRYRARISGPLLDRVDIQVEMPRIPWQQLETAAGENSTTVYRRVVAARRRQRQRGGVNAQLPVAAIDRLCTLNSADRQLLERVAHRFRLSPRAIHRILRVARSIADLDDADRLEARHLQEAVGYRCLDRQAGHD